MQQVETVESRGESAISESPVVARRAQVEKIARLCRGEAIGDKVSPPPSRLQSLALRSFAMAIAIAE
jgi:hypothetical protein